MEVILAGPATRDRAIRALAGACDPTRAPMLWCPLTANERAVGADLDRAFYQPSSDLAAASGNWTVVTPALCESSGPTIVRLSGRVPTASLDMGPVPAASVLELTVAEVQPGDAAFLLVAAVRDKGDRTAAIGKVSLYPVGQTGRFVLPLRGAVAEAFAAAGGVLTLTLQPISSDRPLPDGLEVEIRDIGLQANLSMAEGGDGCQIYS